MRHFTVISFGLHNNFQCRLSVPNFIVVDFLVSEMDEQTDTSLPLWFHSMHFMQRKHNKKYEIKYACILNLNNKTLNYIAQILIHN
jgi:hypothetical protein